MLYNSKRLNRIASVMGWLLNNCPYNSFIISFAAETVTEYDIPTTICIPACNKRLLKLVSLLYCRRAPFPILTLLSSISSVLSSLICFPDWQALRIQTGIFLPVNKSVNSAASTGTALPLFSPSKKINAFTPS